MEFKPNFFILGAAKCGTTTLHAYLDRMPDICMSCPKEPFFFEAEHERGLEYYREKYFSHWSGEPVIGDARHRNLYLPYVPERIREVNPDAKLVAILRNPVERCFSHWMHQHESGMIPVSFGEAVRQDVERIQRGSLYATEAERLEHAQCVLDPARSNDGIYSTIVDTGYYHEQLQRYFSLFPEEQIKVLLLDDLRTDPESIVRELVLFLSLDPDRNRYVQALHENPARRRGSGRQKTWKRRLWKWSRSLQKRGVLPDGIWRYARDRWEPRLSLEEKPIMEEDLRVFLNDHYREHNLRLEQLIGRDLSCWC